MKQKRSRVSVVFELAAVLLVTILSFMCGAQIAQVERVYAAYGGEYLLLLVPPAYYAGKRTILDWVADIRKKWKEGRQ